MKKSARKHCVVTLDKASAMIDWLIHFINVWHPHKKGILSRNFKQLGLLGRGMTSDRTFKEAVNRIVVIATGSGSAGG